MGNAHWLSIPTISKQTNFPEHSFEPHFDILFFLLSAVCCYANCSISPSEFHHSSRYVRTSLRWAISILTTFTNHLQTNKFPRTLNQTRAILVLLIHLPLPCFACLIAIYASRGQRSSVGLANAFITCPKNPTDVWLSRSERGMAPADLSHITGTFCYLCGWANDISLPTSQPPPKGISIKQTMNGNCGSVA
jgi:hypothetical protein